jgi:hypothetical protein
MKKISQFYHKKLLICFCVFFLCCGAKVSLLSYECLIKVWTYKYSLLLIWSRPEMFEKQLPRFISRKRDYSAPSIMKTHHKGISSKIYLILINQQLFCQNNLTRMHKLNPSLDKRCNNILGKESQKSKTFKKRY